MLIFVTSVRSIMTISRLQSGLDPSLWPNSKELDQMAADLAKAKKNGVKQCFLYVDLRFASSVFPSN